jgi:DNA-binding PadR family transcriptional regulator
MSSTRLLILGVVRIFQPVHGYFVRRELVSWRADQWANVNPGSIYNALRTLTNEHFLEEQPGEASSRARALYRLTPDGVTEFETLLREAFWSLNEYSPDVLYAAIGFMTFLGRDEIVASLEHRIALIKAAKIELDYKAHAMRGSDTIPEHTAETLLLASARLDGELGWAQALVSRVRDGAYVFAGESG